MTNNDKKTKIDAIHKNVPADYYQTHYKKNPFVRYWHKKRINQLSRFLQSRDGKILDVGCSSGFLTNQFKDIVNGELYGIDLSDRAIAYAIKSYPSINFQVGDIEKGLDFENNYFDTVLLFNVTEHLVDFDAASSEIARLLKKGGRLLIGVDNENILFRFIWAIWTRMAGKVWQGTHVNHSSINNMIIDLRKKDFKLISSKKTLHNLYWIGEFKLDK